MMFLGWQQLILLLFPYHFYEDPFIFYTGMDWQMD